MVGRVALRPDIAVFAAIHSPFPARRSRATPLRPIGFVCAMIKCMDLEEFIQTALRQIASAVSASRNEMPLGVVDRRNQGKTPPTLLYTWVPFVIG